MRNHKQRNYENHKNAGHAFDGSDGGHGQQRLADAGSTSPADKDPALTTSHSPGATSATSAAARANQAAFAPATGVTNRPDGTQTSCPRTTSTRQAAAHHECAAFHHLHEPSATGDEQTAGIHERSRLHHLHKPPASADEPTAKVGKEVMDGQMLNPPPASPTRNTALRWKQSASARQRRKFWRAALLAGIARSAATSTMAEVMGLPRR